MNKAYPKYKPSGVEWLGDVPEHWEVKRLKTSAYYWVSNVNKVPDENELPVRLCNYTDVYYNDFVSCDMELMETTATAEEIKKFHLEVDDVVITKDSEEWDDIAISALVVKTEPNMVCGYHLAIIRPIENKLIGKYLARQFQSSAINHQFQIAATGVTRYGLPKSAIGEAIIPLPPLPEQQAIAAFLDRETGRIDALIAKKERLLELLAEQRSALISRAVTKGLDASVKLKPSGVEWLGDVPEHWEVKKVRRFILEHKQGYYSTDSYTDEGYRLLRISDFDGNGFVQTTDCPFVEKKADAVQFLLKENDFVFARTGGAGSFGLIKNLSEETIFASYLIRFRFDRTAYAEFLRYAFTSKQFIHGIISNIHGGVNQNVHAEDIKEQNVPLPPLPEQQAIAAFLDRETAKIDALSSKVTTVIERLKEYRTALISSAVTGKIDVREAV